MITAVRESHASFYGRFGFMPMAVLRPSPGLNSDPALLVFVKESSAARTAPISIFDEVDACAPIYAALNAGAIAPIRRHRQG